MRYALRNQDKIEKAFPGLTKSIIASLDKAFEGKIEIENTGEKYPILLINDTRTSYRNDSILYNQNTLRRVPFSIQRIYKSIDMKTKEKSPSGGRWIRFNI